ncbi:hypothetical protein [Kaistia terrae]|uniref:AI-2E family transporter n=1 Tax=Kaistia terrae TaxID=537017 RepID=A0ABW0Q338_9HYPH|nr:hypothetical protein [Kaistia terrae]MCX5578971.1 hypothetical protein [Kaistia terrae]
MQRPSGLLPVAGGLRARGLVGGAIIGLVIGLPLLIDALMRIWSWLPHRGP